MSAPELLTPIISGRPSALASDVWAAGLVLFQLLGGKLQHQTFLDSVMSGSCEAYPGVDQIDGLSGDLVRGMLAMDAAQRLTMDQVCGHAWFAL